MFGLEYLKEAITSLYQEHVAKLINQKADEFREEAREEMLRVRKIVVFLLLAIFLLLVLAHFWPEPAEEKENN